jgi:ligand-binding SRPBCC domain-containing protein
LGQDKKRCIFEHRQFFAINSYELWDFIARPANLLLITPPFLKLEIKNDVKGLKMYENLVLVLQIRVLSFFKLSLHTRIIEIKNGEYFIDKLENSIFSYWQHTHTLVERDGGVEMIDKIEFDFGSTIFNTFLNECILRNSLKLMFKKRAAVLARFF